MTYRSESRGFMYTAPPGPDETENRPTDAETAETTETTQATETAAEATADEGSPERESTTAATDANWTGTVSADD